MWNGPVGNVFFAKISVNRHYHALGSKSCGPARMDTLNVGNHTVHYLGPVCRIFVGYHNIHEMKSQ